MQINFKDGKRAELDTKMNIKKLLFINRDFNTDDLVTISVNGKGGQDINIVTAVKAVYVAYRQANMNNYMSWDAFLDTWELNTTFAFEVYKALIMGNVANKTEFQETFKTKKHQGASSSQN